LEPNDGPVEPSMRATGKGGSGMCTVQNSQVFFIYTIYTVNKIVRTQVYALLEIQMGTLTKRPQRNICAGFG
jgi:hypothetical protein